MSHSLQREPNQGNQDSAFSFVLLVLLVTIIYLDWTQDLKLCYTVIKKRRKKIAFELQLSGQRTVFFSSSVRKGCCKTFYAKIFQKMRALAGIAGLQTSFPCWHQIMPFCWKLTMLLHQRVKPWILRLVCSSAIQAAQQFFRKFYVALRSKKKKCTVLFRFILFVYFRYRANVR